MRLLLAAGLLFVAGAVLAQQDEKNPPSIETSKVFGEYEVFYSVIPSTMLTEAVAAEYHITRAKDRSVVNIAVRKHKPEGGDDKQTATVSGTASDLMQSRKLDFREIDESGAVYYLADLRHTDRELLRFDIKVQIEPDAPPRTLTFTRKLYLE